MPVGKQSLFHVRDFDNNLHNSLNILYDPNPPFHLNFMSLLMSVLTYNFSQVYYNAYRILSVGLQCLI